MDDGVRIVRVEREIYCEFYASKKTDFSSIQIVATDEK